MNAAAVRQQSPCPTMARLSRRRSATDAAIIHAVRLEDLDQIHVPAVELVIWQRQLVAGLSAWLAELHPEQCPDGRLLVPSDACRAAFTALLDEADTPTGSMRDSFLADLVSLSEAFCRTMDTDVLDIRLETVRHDGCWKYHRDHVPARLLTTYRGPGTQWVRPEHSEAALLQQKTYGDPVEQFSEHAVGLFKGNTTEHGRGIVHRSPPILGTGATRILLCLNLPSAASPELRTL
jgi:hypothetical protein